MRIIATSDTHRNARDFLAIIERHMDNADLFVNLGDSERETELLSITHPKLKTENVAGNCDWNSTLPFYKMLHCADKKVLLTHGHQQYVKHGYQQLQAFAMQEGADICLFGHTHTPYVETVNGILYMNPGAVINGSYGVIDITANGIMAYHNTI